MLTDDLEDLIASVSDGDPSRPVFVTSARGAGFLVSSDNNAFKDVSLTGGKIAGVPLLISPAAADRLIMIDSAEVAVADAGLEIALSGNASIQLLDNPTNNSATGTATDLVSAFQTDMRVLRLIRFVSWKLLRADACAFVSLPVGGSPA